MKRAMKRAMKRTGADDLRFRFALTHKTGPSAIPTLVIATRRANVAESCRESPRVAESCSGRTGNPDFSFVAEIKIEKRFWKRIRRNQKFPTDLSKRRQKISRSRFISVEIYLGWKSARPSAPTSHHIILLCIKIMCGFGIFGRRKRRASSFVFSFIFSFVFSFLFSFDLNLSC